MLINPDSVATTTAANNILNASATDGGDSELRSWLAAHPADAALLPSQVGPAGGGSSPVGEQDTVVSVNSYTLGPASHNITLTGALNADAAGNALDNHLIGNAGANHILGYAGDDLLDGGVGGADTLDGGSGLNTVSYEHSAAAVSVSLIRSTGASSSGYAQAGAGGDVLIGVQNLAGSAYNDTLTGYTDSNVLNGGAGSDKLIGGIGGDVLIGGAGADSFTYNATNESTVDPAGRDTILDFSHAEADIIDLRKIDAVIGGTDDKFKLVAAFTHTAGQLTVVHDVDHYTVQGDVNGDGLADFAIDVYSQTPLVTTDFLF